MSQETHSRQPKVNPHTLHLVLRLYGFRQLFEAASPADARHASGVSNLGSLKFVILGSAAQNRHVVLWNYERLPTNGSNEDEKHHVEYL